MIMIMEKCVSMMPSFVEFHTHSMAMIQVKTTHNDDSSYKATPILQCLAIGALYEESLLLLFTWMIAMVKT